MGLHVKVAGAWQEISDGGGASSGLPWARIAGGTVTEYAKPDGSIMEVHEFTAAGTLNVLTAGYAEVLLVSGGGSTNSGQTYRGSGGVCREGLQALPAGSLPVVIGAGGLSRNADMWNCIGRPSSLGAFNTGFARSGDSTGPASGAIDTTVRNTAYTSFITGVARTFGVQGANAAVPRANSGDSGNNDNGAGATGSVIVAVQRSAPTVSGIVATGGTITEYTGDGTNGALGQRYRVHTFTANGTLTVTQGGVADVLIVGSGGPGWTNVQDRSGGGGGGAVIPASMRIDGAIPVIVATAQSSLSRFGALTAMGGLTAGGGGGGTSGNGFTNSGPIISGGGGSAGNGIGVTGGPGFPSSISGAEVEYGRGGNNQGAVNGLGNGAAIGATPGMGVVIVRYEIA